jgi:hypothetical protein
MDSRHIKFLQRNGVDTYNNYFNRDKKKNVVEIPIEWLSEGIPPPPLKMKSSRPELDRNDPFNYKYLVKYDPFLYEYRDGENAVPRPPENEKHLVEPESHHYKNVPLEYIREHGVLEFILESEYPYSLESLFYYSKPSEYQIEYLKKLIKEGRLTQKVFRL